jgi:hypothetical protein
MRLQTFSRRTVSPVAPSPDDIAIEDIAHALSHTCRFGGHVSTFYSVAQHSVLVSHVVPAEFALWGLLHDASEAYLVDIPTPLKVTAALDGYKAIEALMQQTIYQRFGLQGPQPPEVDEADQALLLEEADALLPGGPTWATADMRARVPRPPIRIVPWFPPAAKRGFLKRFDELTTVKA